MNFLASKIRWIAKGQDGISATLQTLASRIFMLAVNVLTGVITARILGPTGRGEQAAMILWSGLLASTLTLGLPSSLIYNLKLHSKDKSQLFSAALVLSLIPGFIAVAIGVVFIPVWLSQYPPEVIRLAQWFMLNAPLILVQLVCFAALEAIDDFTAMNQMRSLIPLSSLIAIASFALTNTLTPFTSSLSYVFNSLPIIVWMLVRLWRILQPRWTGLLQASKTLINYGVRSYGIDLLSALALQTDQAFIVGSLSANSMGLYTVALSIARILTIFQISVSTVLFPKAAVLPLSEAISLTGRATRISAAMTLLAGLLIALIGPELLHLLYGSKYLEAVEVMRVLILETGIGGAVGVLAQAFMALGRPGIVTVLQMLGLALSVPLMLVLIPIYGLMGAGLALLGSTLIRLIFILVCFPLVLKVHPPNLLITRGDLSFLKQLALRKD